MTLVLWVQCLKLEHCPKGKKRRISKGKHNREIDFLGGEKRLSLNVCFARDVR
jgi:hypothetical protein